MVVPREILWFSVLWRNLNYSQKESQVWHLGSMSMLGIYVCKSMDKLTTYAVNLSVDGGYNCSTISLRKHKKTAQDKKL